MQLNHAVTDRSCKHHHHQIHSQRVSGGNRTLYSELGTVIVSTVQNDWRAAPSKAKKTATKLNRSHVPYQTEIVPPILCVTVYGIQPLRQSLQTNKWSHLKQTTRFGNTVKSSTPLWGVTCKIIWYLWKLQLPNISTHIRGLSVTTTGRHNCC